MADLTKYCPPLSFAQVSEGIYRSAYPNKSTWSFIKTLQLKRMICLSPSDLRPDLIEFCKEGNIELIEYEIGHNQEPFLSMLSEKVTLVLNLIQGKIL